MEQVKGYKKLKVWEFAHVLAIEIYATTRVFPRHEEYGITSQLRRAALSVPTNIVEGHASASKKEFLNFLNIANRSLVEVEYLLEVALSLKYISIEQYNAIENVRRETGLLLNGLSRAIRVRLTL